MGRLALDLFGPLWGLILFAGGIFFVFVVPALAISAFRATQRLEQQLALLRRELRDLQDRRATADYMPHRPSHPVAPAPEPVAPPGEPAEPEPPIAATPPVEAAPVVAPEPPAPSAPLRSAVEPTPRGLEQRLGARGFVWLGGACIALASFFLVKYSIEEGLLGPGMQVVLVLLLGHCAAGRRRLHAAQIADHRTVADGRGRRRALCRSVRVGRALSPACNPPSLS